MSKFIFLCFLFLLSAPFISLVTAGSASVKRDKTAKSRKSVVASMHELFETLTDFGGETVSTLFEEFSKNLENTAALANSLANPQVIDFINFSIKSALRAFRESAQVFESVKDRSDYVTAANMEKFLETFQSKLMTELAKHPNFSPLVANQLETYFPLFIDAIVQTYGNIYESISMGLTYGMVIRGTGMLSIWENVEFVNDLTFKHFASMPTQVISQVEELVGALVTPEQVEMAHMMVKMYLAQVKPRSHDDL